MQVKACSARMRAALAEFSRAASCRPERRVHRHSAPGKKPFSDIAFPPVQEGAYVRPWIDLSSDISLRHNALRLELSAAAHLFYEGRYARQAQAPLRHCGPSS